MFEQCEREIIGLHVFFEQWLRAEVPKSDELMRRFVDVTPPEFTLISPAGSVSFYEQIAKAIFDGYGTSPTMRLWADNVQLCHTLPGGYYMLTYHEWQQYGDGEPSLRLSSVLLHEKPGTPNGLEWLHLHETWINPPKG